MKKPAIHHKALFQQPMHSMEKSTVSGWKLLCASLVVGFLDWLISKALVAGWL